MAEAMSDLLTVFREQMVLQQEQHRQQMESLMALMKSSSGLGTKSVPSFTPFDPSSELWTDYYARFNTFVEAHSVQENKRSHIFLTNQSPVTFKLLDNLAKQKSPPMDINSLTMKEIEEFMLEQFHPKRFVVRERYKFWAEIRRKPGETIQDLAARIRQDAVTCDFSSITNPQDEAMRTRFICSCENETVLKAPFKIKDDDLSFSRAIEIATQIEDAAKCAKETVYGTSTGSSQVKKIKKPNAPARPTEHAHQTFRPKHKIRQDFPVGTCGRCGGPHGGKDCKFKKAVCRFCQKTGHIEKVCLQKRKFVSKIETFSTVKRMQIFPHLQVSAELRDNSVSFEVDTGAGDNFICSEIWHQMGKPPLQPVTSRFESASGHPLPVLGSFQEKIKVEGTKPTLINLVVTKISKLNILGRSAIKELNISVDRMLQQIKQINGSQSYSKSNQPNSALQTACKSLCAEFPTLFSPGLGLLKDFELDIKFRVDAKPVFCKPRTVPLAVQHDLEKAYDAGIAKGIWKPTTFGSYGTPVVPIRKKALQGQTKAQIRVCGDCSVTVNPQLETHRHPIPKPEDLMRRLGGGHYFSVQPDPVVPSLARKTRLEHTQGSTPATKASFRDNLCSGIFSRGDG